MSSLTIREGVSRCCICTPTRMTFPHYTWGCIHIKQERTKENIVPSLYVRVYHFLKPVFPCFHSSLTIREGVSSQEGKNGLKQLFPHYTWGCIVSFKRLSCCRFVPSLYVRVYREAWYTPLSGFGSLTIREGVSLHRAAAIKKCMFPHYTWGCITQENSPRRHTEVPSLYVRVYRLWCH